MAEQRKEGAAQLSGFFNVYKPSGVTSHDVVAQVRRASRQRRVGHGGTLDPLAEGVLVICMGEATRLAEYLIDGKKTYRAWIHFGATTDTYDAEGAVTSRSGEVPGSLSAIEEALRAFVGRIEQVPPMYSALKREGKPLYKLARQGIELPREPRVVTVYEFRILAWSPPVLEAEITCSKGTYIRSLAHDLGQALGCGAYLARLVRTASGPFTLEEAVPLQELLDRLARGDGHTLLVPMDRALCGQPAWTVDAETARRIRQGQRVRGIGSPQEARPGAIYRAYTEDGRFLAILGFDDASSAWQPLKVFASEG